MSYLFYRFCSRVPYSYKKTTSFISGNRVMLLYWYSAKRSIELVSELIGWVFYFPKILEVIRLRCQPEGLSWPLGKKGIESWILLPRRDYTCLIIKSIGLKLHRRHWKRLWWQRTAKICLCWCFSE